MNIKPVTDSHHERAYGEVHEYRYVEELVVTDDGTSRTLPARAKSAFKHVDGFLLTVDASIYHNEPSIDVETAKASLDDGWDYQRWTFNSFGQLETWLSSNATLV